MSALVRRALAETIGTAVLLATVVGSGVMGAALAQGNDAIALLANACATAAVLYALISLLGPVSGAHFNPIVTVSLWLDGRFARREIPAYLLAQFGGALLGVWLAHAMFDLPILQSGAKSRTGAGQWLAEAVASAGLVGLILLALRQRSQAVPALVAGWIFAAYWFTSSTSFANPAVTLARAFTDTFAGIRAGDVAGFMVAQLIGMALGLGLARVLQPLAGAAAAEDIAPT